MSSHALLAEKSQVQILSFPDGAGNTPARPNSPSWQSIIPDKDLTQSKVSSYGHYRYTPLGDIGGMGLPDRPLQALPVKTWSSSIVSRFSPKK